MRRPPVLLALAAALAACGGGGDAPRPASTPAATATLSPTVTPPRTATPSATATRARRIVATDLAVPWGIDFLPDGDALVAERTTGDIVRIPAEGGRPRVVMNVPGVDTEAGEGGLLGLAVSPGYADDRFVYAYFTSAEDNRIVRFRLGGDVDPILTGLEHSFIHNGGRIAFGPDGKLYAGVGDAARPAFAQDRDALNGKILRLNPDGTVPDDNPFEGSLVWSYGHRNVQGLAWDEDGRLWATEFGQNAFDEVNLIRPGRNYGWPGIEGQGGTDGGRFTNPVLTWTTGEASPSGAAIAGGDLYVAALRGEGVWRVPLDGERAGTPKLLLAGRYGRVRTVVRSPEGDVWLATSNRDGRGSPREGDDRIVRLTGT